MKLLLISGLLFCLMACQAKVESPVSNDRQMDAPPLYAAMETEPLKMEESREFAMQEINFEEPLDTAVVPVPIEASLPIEPENPHQVSKGNSQKTVRSIERKIIRNVDIKFQVEEVGNSAKRIEAAVKTLNGLITSSEESHSDNDLRHHLTVRIPATQLDTFLVVLLNESIYTEHKTITVQDVTKQYVDLEARIKAKKITEAKYLEILKKARNVEEVLKVEEQLGLMREEIETREAELRELKNDVAMSTVNADFYQTVEGVNAPDKPFYAKIWNSFTEGFDLLNSIFLNFFYFLPGLVVLGGISWFLIRWWKKPKNYSK